MGFSLKEEIAWKLITHTPLVTDMAASLTNLRLLLPSVDTKKFLEISMLIPSTKMDHTPSIFMLTPTSNTTAVESSTMNLAPNSPCCRKCWIQHLRRLLDHQKLMGCIMGRSWTHQ